MHCLTIFHALLNEWILGPGTGGINVQQPLIGEAHRTDVRNGAVTVLMVCSFLFLNFVTPWAFDHRGTQAVLFALLGVCIGQLNLIATWAALAPGNIALRLPWSLLLAVFMWYALVAGNRIMAGGFGHEEATLLGLILLFGMLVALIPLWIARHLFGWRLVSWIGARAEDSDSRSGTQFNLRHLLLGMFLLSLAMAPARLVLPEGSGFPTRLDKELCVLLPGVAFCNLVVTVPCIWGAFLPRRTILIVALGWILYGGVLTLVEYGFFTMLLGPAGGSDTILLIYLTNLAQCATVFGTLLVFRACGFRLLRTRLVRRHAE